jgi:hypothetical protein
MNPTRAGKDKEISKNIDKEKEGEAFISSCQPLWSELRPKGLEIRRTHKTQYLP